MTIRTAIIGAGHLGKIHARLIRTIPEFELLVIVDPVEAARHVAAETFGVPVDADHRPWIDRVDAVIVATPTKFHHGVTLDFLSAGKHALVEKPLAPSAAESAELVEASRRTRTVLQVGHVERFNPAWTAVRPRLSAPRHIECFREGPFSGRSTDIGVVFDLMIHDIDLVASLVDSPMVDVESCGASLVGRHEDVAAARLRFESGCTAVLHASRLATVPVRKIRLRTEREFATVDFQTRGVELTKIDERLLRGEIDVERLSADERARLKDRLATELLPTERFEAAPCDAITAELLDFAESIRVGRRPLVAGSDGLEAVRIAERIIDAMIIDGAAAETRRAVLRAPHWHLATEATRPKREAG